MLCCRKAPSRRQPHDLLSTCMCTMLRISWPIHNTYTGKLETMVAGLRTTTASLVLVGSLLLSEHSDAVAANAASTSSSISNTRNGRRGGYNHRHRQLRTRKLSKGVATDELVVGVDASSKKKRSEPDGDLSTRNANADGFQPPVLAGCFRDFKLCEATGTLVSRNPALGCDFDLCPPVDGDNDSNGDGNSTVGDNQDQPPANSSANDASETYTPIDIIEENMPVAPGESDNEYNEGDFLLGDGAWVGCDWVEKKKTERRCEVVTANNELVGDLCPEICNAAAMAMTNYTTVDTSPNNLADMESVSGSGNFTLASGMVADCDWVTKKVDTRCHKKTDDGRQVRYLCPECTHVVQIVTPVSVVDGASDADGENVNIGGEEEDDTAYEPDGLRF